MTENIHERNDIIHRAGRLIAETLPGFFGKISLNIKNGSYINANIEESLKPESEDTKLSKKGKSDDT